MNIYAENKTNHTPECRYHRIYRLYLKIKVSKNLYKLHEMYELYNISINSKAGLSN